MTTVNGVVFSLSSKVGLVAGGVRSGSARVLQDTGCGYSVVVVLTYSGSAGVGHDIYGIGNTCIGISGIGGPFKKSYK